METKYIEEILKGKNLKDEINPKKFKTEQVHIDQIKAGDIIINMNGENSTICKNSISWGSFSGRSLKGQTWWGGHLKVTRYITDNNGCLIPCDKLKSATEHLT